MKIKIIPKRKYVINPKPEIGTAGLGVYFNEDASLLALRPEEPDTPGFILSREAAIDLAQLILLEMGKPEKDFAIAYTSELPKGESAAPKESA